MSWPASMSAARTGTAKSGVPMKARRSRVIAAAPHRQNEASDGLGGLLALRLLQLAQDDVALQRRDVVDEEDALEMVHLVLDHRREQARGFERADLVLAIEIADADLRRAGHVGI